jgi:hypothetical protein
VTPPPAAPAQSFAAPLSRDGGYASRDGGFAREPAPAPAWTREPAPAPREEPNEPTGRAGWMSDLLRRASRDEPAPVPAPQPARAAQADGLNTLSVDIARAIDDEAYHDLWDRWQTGERHVFSRRLYTLQGQQTFEEMRRKYQRDVEFRSSVDRYVADFEALLTDASRAGRDPETARGYLASDTGKVYTMLAHASGRLD